jgi:hypothetical protein
MYFDVLYCCFFCPVGVLMPEEVAWLMAQPHKQLALGQALSNILAAADIHSMTKSSLDLMLNRWTFTFGAFGRIYNTAIPSAYTRCGAIDLEQYEAVHVLGVILPQTLALASQPEAHGVLV